MILQGLGSKRISWGGDRDALRRLSLLVFSAFFLSGFWGVPAQAAVFYVDGTTGDDGASGKKSEPWKTLTRAGTAGELKPGDTVIVRAGVYREEWTIRAQGAPGKPIRFLAQGEVVVSAAEVFTGGWEKGTTSMRRKLSEDRFWKNSRFPDGIPNERRHISMLVRDGVESYRLIGSHGVYGSSEFNAIGSGPGDVVEHTFFYDKQDDYLYVGSGHPSAEWEVGVRPGVLGASGHDYSIEGFTFRGPNRQVGKQWSMCNIDGVRWEVRKCRFLMADFVGLTHVRSKWGKVVECEIAYSESQGHSIQLCEDITISKCWIHNNGHGPLKDSWGVRAGVKYIPYNNRIRIEECLVERNGGVGIWFDTCGVNCVATGNIIRFNEYDGIHFEISKGKFLAEGNEIYRNGSRGIYLRGTPDCRIVGNTVIENWEGIAVTPDSAGARVEGNRVAGSGRADMVLWPGTATAGRNRYRPGAKFLKGWGRPASWEEWRKDFDRDSKMDKTFRTRVWNGFPREQGGPQGSLGE